MHLLRPFARAGLVLASLAAAPDPSFAATPKAGAPRSIVAPNSLWR